MCVHVCVRVCVCARVCDVSVCMHCACMYLSVCVFDFSGIYLHVHFIL